MKPARHLLTLGLFAVPLGAQADIFAREDFNYTNGFLATNAGGVGWAAPWVNAEDTPQVLNSKGVVNTTNGRQAARLISTLQEPPAGGSKTVWVSFEAQQTTNVSGSTTTQSYGGLGLFRGNTEQLLIGKSWPGSYEWKAGAGLGLVGAATPVSTLNLTKIIARISMVDAATDTLDVWLNPADTSSVAALGAPQITRTDADLSFDTLRIRCGESDGAVTNETWAFDAIAAGDTLADVVASDSDNDGMLDAWETANGLVVGIDDSGGDPDNDQSPNLQEFQRSTDPHNRDTDFDSLDDGVETGTGIFVNANDTGTSPTLADTDGDTYMDGDENNSGVFVDEFDLGTNPNLADTDGDTHRDDFEVKHGSNPNSALSVPATGDLAIVGSDNFDAYPDGAVAGLAGGSGFDFDNTTANNPFVGHGTLGTSDWDEVFGTSSIAGGKLLTRESGAKREFNGPGEGEVAGDDEYTGAVNEDATTAGKVLYFRADMKRGADATWSGISGFDFGTERAFAGVVNQPNPESGQLEFSIGRPEAQPVYSGVPVSAGVEYTLVVKIDYPGDTISLWVNPDLDAPESAPLLSAPYTIGNWLTSCRLGSGGATNPTEWDNFVVAREWSALSVFPGVTPGDDYAAWISGFPVGGQTGFAQDPDGDGLSNGIENVLGSNPSTSSTGLRAVSSTTPGSFVFRHSRASTPASDVTATYQWSPDLVNWYASGQTAPGGITTTIADSVISNDPLEIEVTATVTAGAAPKIFVRLKAAQN